MGPHMNMKLHAGEESMDVKLAGKVNIFSIVGFCTCTGLAAGTQRFLKTQFGRPEKGSALLAAAQLGERHPSKLMFPHSLNWHGMYQVCQ